MDKKIKEKIINSFAIYSRKSKFTGKGESIGNQIELCRQYIKINYPHISDENIIIYEDEGFSGKNINRPQFKQMMSDCEKKKFDAIICYRLDRVSRNIGDFANLIEKLDCLNISFVSIKETFDTESSFGRAMIFISSVFSQLERETIAERIRDNMLELAKTGRWLGGITPTGYISEPVESLNIDGKIKKAYKLSIVEEEIKIVKTIFDKFLETNSLSKTESFLLINDIKTKRGNKFTRFTIKNILVNPVYMIADKDAYMYFSKNNVDLFNDENEFDGKYGIMAYNKTIQKDKRANEIRDICDWIIAVGKHTGIISGKNWVKVQECLEQNKSKTFRKPKSNTALLSGLLYCGKCGDYMRPKMSQRMDKDGEYIFNYLCETKEKTRCTKCDLKNPNGNTLDKMVCEEVKKLAEDSSDFFKELEAGKKQLETNSKDYENDLEQAKNNYSENQKNIDKLVMALTKAENTPAYEHIFKQINELSEKGEALAKSINELENLTKNNFLNDEEFDILKQILISFKETFNLMSIEEKRAALRTFIDKVVWDGENVHIYFFGAKGERGDMEYFEPQGDDSKCYVSIDYTKLRKLLPSIYFKPIFLIIS